MLLLLCQRLCFVLDTLLEVTFCGRHFLYECISSKLPGPTGGARHEQKWLQECITAKGKLYSTNTRAQLVNKTARIHWRVDLLFKKILVPKLQVRKSVFAVAISSHL